MLEMRQGEYIMNEGAFKSTWESLKQYECPEWFRNAKFGIWAHWGPQAVSGAGDWYARNIYIEGSSQYKYHLEHYGHPSNFGYKDILPLWHAEKFDPEKLIKLYKEAGARYFVALAVHHDNYDCWDSKYHKWNSVNIGPKKDIVGMWHDAAIKAGLRFGVTEHLERSYSWFNVNKGCDNRGEYAGVKYDGNDPKYEDFYYPYHEDTSYGYPTKPSNEFMWQWYARIKDLVDKYQPDLLYTDGAVPFGEIGRKMIANFYNGNMNNHNGKLEAVYNLKDTRNFDMYHGEYEDNIGVQDIERGVVNDIYDKPWQTDTCIGGWYYNKFVKYKTAQQVIHMLIDIVSKNGNLLLNFPLRPDGTLDNEALEVVKGITSWMKINSQAIYDTRPWIKFGEGPTNSSAGHFKEQKIEYTSEDFRFTQKGNILYAICLNWPNNGRILIKSLNGSLENDIKNIQLLGYEGKLTWNKTDKGIFIDVPDKKPCEYAYTFKIEL